MTLAAQVEALLAELPRADEGETLTAEDQRREHAVLVALGDLGFRDADHARKNLPALHEAERRRAAE